MGDNLPRNVTLLFEILVIIIIIIRLSLYHQIYEFLKVTFKNLLNYNLSCFVALA